MSTEKKNSRLVKVTMSFLVRLEEDKIPEKFIDNSGISGLTEDLYFFKELPILKEEAEEFKFREELQKVIREYCIEGTAGFVDPETALVYSRD